MCARFTLSAPADAIVDLFDLDLLLDILPRFNIAPTQNVLSVRLSGEGKPEFVPLRWGLVPSWANDISIGQKLLNARSETVGEKPAFRDAIRKRRCLIPADGFFEWKTLDKKKLPYHIHRPDRRPFAFAGIWEHWEAPDGKPLETCSILTTTANAVLRPLHDRMPVILGKEQHARWLDPNVKQAKELEDLFAPLPDDVLTMNPVTPKVNRPQFEGPSCIEPIDAAPPQSSGTLWDE
jgi:putative SOS response-associated peptidase YedK